MSRPRPRRSLRNRYLLRLILLLGIAALIGFLQPQWLTGGDSFTCPGPNVIDGDTFRCGDTIVRLEGIDAPERQGLCQEGRHCTPGDADASTVNLRDLIEDSTLECRRSDTDQHGRTIARCAAGDIDLSCAQVQSGHAVKRYATIFCLP